MKAHMDKDINKNDVVLLSYISECTIVTVSQLSALCRRSRQVIRRRLRLLEHDGLVITRIRGYGKNQGRPEEIISLTERGHKILQDEGIVPSTSVFNRDMPVNAFTIDHEVLVNWFYIHLIQLERNITELTVRYINRNLHLPNRYSVSQPSSNKCLSSASSGQSSSANLIPDGVFAICNKNLEKTLLFFLEVDLGTESLASTNRTQKDIRQKIINYQTVFRSGRYRRYEKVFDATLNGFRLLFITNTSARLNSLCRLVQEMPPSDFVWLAEQEQMFSRGVSSTIWVRGGHIDKQRQSIVGGGLACDSAILDSIS